jgi:uncharacterized protein related to proFAR isomerase
MTNFKGDIKEGNVIFSNCGNKDHYNYILQRKLKIKNRTKIFRRYKQQNSLPHA